MSESATAKPPLTTPAPAGLLRRVCSLVYEALLLAAVLFFAGYVFSALLPRASAGWERNVFQFALFSVGGLYFGWSWSAGRRTLPMKTWRLRLETTTGEALSWRAALKRYIFAWAAPLLALGGYLAAGPWGLAVGALPYLWALVDPDRQFLHDRLSGTRILRESPSVAR